MVINGGSVVTSITNNFQIAYQKDGDYSLLHIVVLNQMKQHRRGDVSHREYVHTHKHTRAHTHTHHGDDKRQEQL